MRTAVVLLIVVNLALFAYARLTAQGEGARLAMQVAPERIRVMSAQEGAALAPGKGTPATVVCAEWGPFAEADRVRAEGDLEPLAPGRLVSQRPLAAEPGSYWVNLGPIATRGAAEQRAAELRAQAIVDLSVVEYGRGQYTVSLGVFRTQAAAGARAENLLAPGVTGTRVEPRAQAGGQAMLVVRDAREPLVARLRELQAQYPGTEVRFAPCS